MDWIIPIGINIIITLIGVGIAWGKLSGMVETNKVLIDENAKQILNLYNKYQNCQNEISAIEVQLTNVKADTNHNAIRLDEVIKKVDKLNDCVIMMNAKLDILVNGITTKKKPTR